MPPKQKPSQEDGRRRLVVFWEGTANTLNPMTTQIGLFSKACLATRVRSAEDARASSQCYKISFDGCGVTHGNWGVLFANGLGEQCDRVVEIVQELLEQGPKGGVHVVAVGLSRGGMACMKLARALSQFDEQQVTCSTCLFDPVPGNAVSTGFPWTASYAYDLSECSNLKRVLALYPYEALPDLAMHAPTLGRYNRKTTLVQEDVCMGCHQGALLMPNVAPPGQFPDLSMRRILDWLACEGVQCQMPVRVPTPLDCVELMDYIRKRAGNQKSVRKTHDVQRRKILRHAKPSGKRWLNRYHEQLVQALDGGDSSSSQYAVYGDPVKQASGSYQLDFDEGYILCPSPLSVGR